MSDNSWYENGELPPVGSKCIVDSIACPGAFPRSFHGMKVDINFHMVDKSSNEIAVFSMVDPEDRDCLKFHGMVKGCFRPIKSDRELAIEAAVNELSDTIHLKGNVMHIAGLLFDAGLPRSKNEAL